ncbi:MAG: carboxypeptidase-like regulatory domain-containing protein [Gemmatimonadota bacterium]
MDGIVSADTDERRNRLVYGYLSEEAIAAAEAALALTSVPQDAVILELQDPVCTLLLRPSIVVEVRDAAGDPAAIGATVTARTSGFETAVEGAGDPLRIWVFAGNRGGIFEVRVSKPGHVEAVLPQVVVPEGPCGVTEAATVQVTILPLPDATALSVP